MEQYEEMEQEKKKDIAPYVIVTLASVGFILFFIFFKDSIFGINETEDELDIGEGNVVVNEDLLKGFRFATVENYKEAIHHFEQIKFKDLSNEDQFIVLNTYLNANQAQKALELDESFDKNVIDYYLAHNQMEQLRELKTKTDLIQFEIAILDSDYEKIIAIHEDVEGIEYDLRRGRAVAHAYYALDRKEDAVNFISLMLYDGVNLMVNENNIAEIDLVEKQTTSNNTTKGIFVTVLTIFALISVVGMVFIWCKKGKPIFKKKPMKKETKHEESTYYSDQI